jgi:hypothetical protein
MSNKTAALLGGLYREFAHYYTTERCEWAPDNPERVFNLAFKTVYPRYRKRLTPEQFLAEVYGTLGFSSAQPDGLFQTFDPAKYTGAGPLTDQLRQPVRPEAQGTTLPGCWADHRQRP